MCRLSIYYQKNIIFLSIAIIEVVMNNKSNTPKYSLYEHTRYVNNAYYKIKGIVPRIHRVEAYLKRGDLITLILKLGAYTPNKEGVKDTVYEKVKYFKLEKVKFSFHYWSPSNRPDYKIKVTNPTPEALIELSRRVPELTVSYVEYAIDFMCEESKFVPYVHGLLRRYLRFPGYTGPVYAAGTPFIGGDDDRVENSVSYFSNTGKKPNAVKIYERGPDSTKQWKDGKPWWHMDDVDRVRLEFIFSKERGGYHLRKHRLKDFGYFAICPEMEKMLEGRFQFCVFKEKKYKEAGRLRGKPYPLESDHYYELDDSGGIESFHLEYLEAEKRGVNARMYCIEARSMAPLMRMIRQALARYDESWREAAKAVYENRYGKFNPAV